jgi:hypothetical protein
MSFALYADLQGEIAGLIVRDDQAASIPGWIELAEAAMNRTLRVTDMVTTAAITISSGTVALPADFLAPIALKINYLSGKKLTFFTPNKFSEQAVISGVPEYYTISGSNLLISPPPTGSFSASLTYRAKIPALSNTNTSNWVLAKHPQAYLYGAAVHWAAKSGDQRGAGWEALFQSALSEIQHASDAQSYGGELQTSSGL